jgi:hypothetical protein
MKIPTELKAKTKTYKIEFDKEALRDDGRYGVTYHTKQKIILDPTQPKDGLDSTFLHEVIHVIIDQSGLRTDLKDRDLSEKVATTIGEDLLLVIRENKLDFRE